MLALLIPLTDDDITSKIDQIHLVSLNKNLIAIIAVAVIAIVCLILSFIKFHRSIGDQQKLAICLMALSVFGGFGAAIPLLNIRSTSQEIYEIASEWHVRESTITDLEMDVDTHRHRTSNGRYKTTTTTSYYATFTGVTGKVTLTAEQYRSWQEGDEVYLIINSAGNIETLYQMDEYEYVGDKLK